MNLKTTLVGAALTLSMAPLAARADGYYSQQPQYEQQPAQQQYEPQYQQPYQYPQDPGIAVGEPRPDGRYDRGEGWYDRGGHYELRTVQRWVAGQYQQVWVPEQCNTRFGRRGWYRAAANVCIPGHYDQQWTPGHYESVQQQVWVPFGFRNHHRWQRGFNPRGI